ncbi:MAG: hypothetical protein JWL77_3508, partial [Chthonomonadaceae bacterium]|nr:hypothetical protein [Chthonomonadaceae bacterium]
MTNSTEQTTPVLQDKIELEEDELELEEMDEELIEDEIDDELEEEAPVATLQDLDTEER